jgi:hypothetical protein
MNPLQTHCLTLIPVPSSRPTVLDFQRYICRLVRQEREFDG